MKKVFVSLELTEEEVRERLRKFTEVKAVKIPTSKIAPSSKEEV